MTTTPAQLLATFRDAARARGALAADEAVSLESAFRVVRDLPWAPSAPDASGAQPEPSIEEWRGTGREKHLLLSAILEALGYETGLLAVTCEFSEESTPWLPAVLLDEVREAPVPDVALLLRVQTNRMLEEWMTLDATWPLAAGGLGLPVNERIVPGTDHHLAVDPIEIFHLSPEDDEDEPGATAALIERILRDHLAANGGDAPGAMERRARFLEALAAWLAASTGSLG